MENCIKEITRQLEQKIITKDEADKILLNLFIVKENSAIEKLQTLIMLCDYYKRDYDNIRFYKMKDKLDEIYNNYLK